MKQAGKSTRDMAFKRYLARIAIGLAGCIVIWLILKYGLKHSMVYGIGGIFAVIIAMKFISVIAGDAMKGVHKKEKRAVRGAAAEEKIGEILEALPKSQYRVMHDVRSPYGNIDHVIVTKNGNVFLIETKAHGGTVTMSGSQLLVNNHPPEKDFIRQITSNAYWLKGEVKRLTGSDVWINSILIFTNAFVSSVPPTKGIQIINKRYLIEIIQRKNSQKTSGNIWAHLLLLETLNSL